MSSANNQLMANPSDNSQIYYIHHRQGPLSLSISDPLFRQIDQPARPYYQNRATVQLYTGLGSPLSVSLILSWNYR